MANLNENEYFKSSDIKVFPSSFRGAYTWGTKASDPDLNFDPESRLNTEANFILPKVTLGKDTYIVNYNKTDQIIAFILGGYYFEISALNQYMSKIEGKYLGITLREIELQAPAPNDTTLKYDGDRTTKVLDSWYEDSNNILDYKSAQNEYYFTGLKILASDKLEGAVATIKLFNDDGSINQNYYLPDISHASGENTLIHGEGLKAAGKNQTIIGEYNKNDTNNLFEVGCGNGDNSTARKNALEISKTKTTIRIPTNITADTLIHGNTYINKDLEVIGKVSSRLTLDTDLNSTLTTKSYVDKSINDLDFNSIGADGKFIKTIEQVNGKIEATTGDFKTTLSDTDNESHSTAPTTGAVVNYVNNKIDNLDVTEVGGGQTYIRSIKEENGKIIATPQIFVQNIYTSNDPTVVEIQSAIPPSTQAVANYVTTSITNALGDLDYPNPALNGGMTGKYIGSISQTNGKIAVAPVPFLEKINTVIDTDHKKAPTAEAVVNYIAGAWDNAIIKTGDNTSKSLQRAILDAFYPVGTIYIQYRSPDEALPESCPIAALGNSTWELISPGTFLCAADSANKNYTYGQGKTGGSADAVLVNHTHSGTTTASTVTIHNNTTATAGHIWFRAINGGKNTIIHRADGICTNGWTSDADSIYSSGDKRATITGWDNKVGPTDNPKITFNTTHSHSTASHTHGYTTTTLSVISNANGEYAEVDSGIKKNLPPYLTVYMWKRTK